jgi:hypothetical protein
MRTRHHRVQVRLDDKEYQHFVKIHKKSGISQEAFLRHLINGCVPNEAPPPEYFAMMKELHYVGVNLNQISVKAHSLGFIDCLKYDKAYEEFQEIVKQITETIILPRRTT